MRPAHRTIRGYAAIGLTMLVLAGTSACAKERTGTTDASGVTLVRSGKLVTCTHLPYPPFQGKDASGTVVGFDVDLIDLVAKKLGVTQEVVDTPFEGIKTGTDLNVGKCDVAAAGMTITEERKKVIDFSDPYFDATQALVVAGGKPYKTLADLAGKRVGVQAATTGEEYVNAQVKAGTKVEAVAYRDLAGAQQALATGQIEAAVGDIPVWNEYVKKNPGKVVVVAGFDTGERYGFAVKKGANPALLKTINETLAEARSSGTYDQIYAKWIGAKPAS